MFVVEAASALRNEGHQVAVCAEKFAELAHRLKDLGVELLTDPRACPWQPDIIHGQHRLHALKALAAFPRTPAVLQIHGFMPALEKPFCHPRILRYITISQGARDYWSGELGLGRDRFDVLLGGVDTARFTEVRPPPQSPRTALLYCNSGFTPGEVACLERACARRDITLRKAGLLFQREVERPEKLLPEFDLVFAVGRSALEAAASGCGVLPVAGPMAEELLSPSNFERLRDQNMAPAFFQHRKLDEAWILEQIDSWNPSSVAAVAALVREGCSSAGTARKLLSIYERALAEATQHLPRPFEEEFDAMLPLLEADLRDRLKRAEEKLAALSNSTCWKATAPLRWIGNLWRS